LPADEDATTSGVELPVQKKEKNNRQRAAEVDYTPQYETPSRRPSEKRPDSFNPFAWAAAGVAGVMEEVRHNDLGLSEQFWVHLNATRREGLLTAQALLRSLLVIAESKTEQEKDRQVRRERRGDVKIDF
jgi:hypothetical protein